MFTGLVEGLGIVQTVERRGPGLWVVIRPPAELQNPSGAPRSMDVQIGESIAINGCCLTVVDVSENGWAFEVGDETLRATNLGDLAAGQAVNLERALAAGARLGGHFVQGHIDGRATVAEIHRNGEWTHVTFTLPQAMSRYLVAKGSVAVDGVSLTVAETEGDRFRVMLIPHTLESTTLGSRKPGDAVNIEVDLLAKYVERLLVRRES
jgi:riboflavin synthase